jgi:hypothetical protein
MSSQGRLVLSQRARIIHLEQKCRWGADQFQVVADALTINNANLYAHEIATSAAAEMDPDFKQEG